jgi:hypothetical protein
MHESNSLISGAFDSQESFDDNDERYAGLLIDTNNLLSAVSISTKKINSVGELSRVASSIFVKIFESIFHLHLEEIIRNPQTVEEYAANAQIVIDALSEQIQMDLQHITGDSIALGDIRPISNLINIFVRIISITSLESHPPGGPRSDGSDSISTHESTFGPIPRPPSTPGIKRSRAGKKQRPSSSGGRRSTGFGADIYRADYVPFEELDDEGMQMLRSSVNMLAQEKKLEEARRRREAARSQKTQQRAEDSRRWAQVSQRAKQKQWADQTAREAHSYRLRKNNEDHKMLRKMYTALLHQKHKWRLEEKKDVRDKVSVLKREAQWHVKSLQNLFEDRVRLLREHDTVRRGEEQVTLHAHRRMAREMKQSYVAKQRRQVDKYRNVMVQRKEQQRMKTYASHKDLLALLSAENWQASLRIGID